MRGGFARGGETYNVANGGGVWGFSCRFCVGFWSLVALLGTFWVVTLGRTMNLCVVTSWGSYNRLTVTSNWNISQQAYLHYGTVWGTLMKDEKRNDM
jgi:hypothetical protein